MAFQKYGTGDGQVLGEDEKSAEQRRQEPKTESFEGLPGEVRNEALDEENPQR